MPRISKWWPLLLVIPAVGWVGVRLLAYNRTSDAVQATLYNADGNLNEAIFVAAMKAKFPDGSPADDVKRFVKQLEGRCSIGPAVLPNFCTGPMGERPAGCAAQVDDTLRCTVPLSGTICVAYHLNLTAHLDKSNHVSNLAVKGETLMC
jgi:hypothetical protein